jgi:hypothetical protein
MSRQKVKKNTRQKYRVHRLIFTCTAESEIGIQGSGMSSGKMFKEVRARIALKIFPSKIGDIKT